MKIGFEAEEKQLHHAGAAEHNSPKIKGRVSGFFAAALTILYAVYTISYFADISTTNASGAIATMFVTPHLVCVVLAASFSLIGFFGKKRWAMLTAGILMAASAALMPTYALMVIFQAILFFVSYTRMGNKS